MVKSYIGEQWKGVKFDFDFTNDYCLEVSNFGRLRSFNKNRDGEILNGTLINGYRILSLKFSTKRDDKAQVKLDNLQQQVFKLAAKLRQQTKDKENRKVIAETQQQLDSLKKVLHKKFMTDLKKRTINFMD